VAAGRSICLDCLIAIKRFEVANSKEIMRRVFSKEFQEATSRLKAFDADKATPADTEQMVQDIELIKSQAPG
jgi:hypothetical protein